MPCNKNIENKRICVFGASSENIASMYIDFAESLGEMLAENGIGIVFGAGRTGLMGAVARGAYRKHGDIIGVIPKKLNVPGVYFENCTERIETETMHERKALMEKLSCAFIALEGGFGTIEELMEVLTLKQLGYHNFPIIICNRYGYYDSLIAQLNKCVNEGFANKYYLNLFSVVSSTDEILDQILNYKSEKIPDKIADVLDRSI